MPNELRVQDDAEPRTRALASVPVPPGRRIALPSRPAGWTWRLIFERRDLWVGVFWDRKPDGLHLFVCPVPTVAMHGHRRT